MAIISLRNNPDDHPPEETAGDKVYAVARAALSSVPLVGSAGAELMGLVLAPPLVKRRDEWLDSLATRLRDLEEKVQGFKVENLADNEAFVSATLQATQVALRTHEKEKLDALRNAVLNVAVGKMPDEGLRTIFLGLVEALTPVHLRLLAIVDDADENDPRLVLRAIRMESLRLRDEHGEIVAQLVRGLRDAGLVKAAEIPPASRPEPEIPFYGVITAFGRAFLTFVSSPVGGSTLDVADCGA